MSRKGPISRNSLPPHGIDPIQAEGRLPWILTVPKEPYYEGVEYVSSRALFRSFTVSVSREARQYLPISLRTLQRLIDLRRINPAKPIDLPVLCNTKLFSIQPDQRQFGLQLVDEVKAIFSLKTKASVTQGRRRISVELTRRENQCVDVTCRLLCV